MIAPPEALFNERFEGVVADGADAFDGVFFLSEHCEPKHVTVAVPAHGGRGAQVLCISRALYSFLEVRYHFSLIVRSSTSETQLLMRVSAK